MGVRNGMVIRADLSDAPGPKRRVHGWRGHPVGGVGTPWFLKGFCKAIEVAAAFACGRNLRCPQCQNWTTAYNGIESALTPHEAAVLMTAARRRYGVESTLNRPWLLRYLRELNALNPDAGARFHVDTSPVRRSSRRITSTNWSERE